LVEYTNVKSPKVFCDGYNPKVPEIPVQIVEQFVIDRNQQYYQPPAHGNEYYIFNSSSYHIQNSQKYEHPTIDLSLQLSVSKYPSIQSGEHHSFEDNQVGTSTSYVDYDKSLGIDLNKSPPKD